MNTAPSTSTTRAQWLLLVLLVVSIFINYIDRSNLSIAAPIIERELSLSPVQIGWLFSAFFWTYALVQLFGVAGWLADRFPVGWVLAGGYFLWSAATIVTGLVSGLPALFLARLMLGAGESVAYPCYSRILATDIPPHHRGLANALIDAGSKLGPALGSFVGAMLVSSIGWRVFFVALGVGSLVWLIPWWVWMPRSHESMRKQTGRGPSVRRILRCRSAWGTFLGHFCGNYFWFFLLTWLPTYLVKERKYSMEGMGRISTMAFLAIATATIVAGWISDRWILAGGSPTRVRKTIMMSGLGFSTVILPVALIDDVTWSITLLFISCIAFGTYASNHWATTQTLAGPLAAGRWTSLQNGVGNLAGIAASWLTGEIVERSGSFHLAFIAAALVVLTGAAMWGFVVGPVKEIEWEKA
jgi:ACS family D-galactonate transporter-like MFS transporter